MLTRRVFGVIAIASLFVLPTVSYSALVQKWQSTAPNHRLISIVGDFNDDGTYKMISGESSAGGEKLGIRSVATNALLAQTALTYQVGRVWLTNLDGDSSPDILLEDKATGRLVCVNYTTGSSTLTVRWNFLPTPGGVPHYMEFVDFDGNGHLYLVFRDDDPSATPVYAMYRVYDRSGTLFGTFMPPSIHCYGQELDEYVDDFDGDGRQEFMVRWVEPGDPYGAASGCGGDYQYVYENNAPPVAVEATSPPRALELGSSFPNPASSDSRIDYSLPSAGSATLRVFDLNGREVRTLVDGQAPAGRNQAIWDGRDNGGRAVPPGAYFYQLNAAGQRVARRAIRLQ